MLSMFHNLTARSTLCCAALGLLTFVPSVQAKPFGKAPEKPRLILQITVDQLRADLPRRYLSANNKGGLRYLLEKGVVYENAHHAHANTETIVGHSTLATGAHPAEHGLVGNVWFDREAQAMVYNIEDERYPLLTRGADVDDKNEIDPTQKMARSEGRSPMTMLVSTFGDELAQHTAGQAKVFGVSVKDRGAVAMAGHAGKAFWFSKAAGEFVTSQYYYSEYPQWVVDFNAAQPIQRYHKAKWSLLDSQESYLFADKDDQAWEADLAGFGRVFPHSYGESKSKYFTTLLTLSPAGDALTLDFAKQLLKQEQLGQDAVTDYLSVSFSSTDYVGHIFGPSSLEAEDNLRHLDKALGELLALIDDEVGLKNTLVVLSADHGAPDPAPQAREYGFAANYVDPDSWDKNGAISALKKEFGLGEELIQAFFPPYIYLNRELIAKKGLDIAMVEKAVAERVMNFEGVSLAISSTALSQGKVAQTPLTQSILNSHNPKRSGDVYVVFEPNWFINDFDGLEVSSTHGSPWNYDTHVPIIFAGMGLKAQRIYRSVETVDVATTLSLVVGAKLPSAASGEGLLEVLNAVGQR